MQRIGHNQIYIAVESAAKGVIARAWRELRVPIIVQPHCHDIVTDDQIGADVVRKSGVTAEMLANQLTVDINLRVLKRRLEFQKHPLTRPFWRDCEMFPIPAIAGVKLRPQKIRQAERVWQADIAPKHVRVIRRLRSDIIAELEFP